MSSAQWRDVDCSGRVVSLKADVSSVSPSSERLEEWWVVWVYNQKTELRYWWEYGDQKTRIN